MAEQHEFFNLYVQNLVNEVTELTKSKILMATQTSFKDIEIGELKKKVGELEEAAATEKDQNTKAWKETLGAKDQEVSTAQHTIADLRRQIGVKDSNIASLTATVDKLNLLVKSKDEEIVIKDADIKEREDVIANLNSQLNAKLNGTKSSQPKKKTNKKKKEVAITTLLE